MEKQDISVNLTALCSLNSALRDIAVLYPQKDLVVTSSGWFSVSEYENYLQRKLQLPANLVTEHLLNVPGCEGLLKPSNFAFHNADYLVYVQQLDILTPPRAIAISCFDKAAMQKLLQQVCGEQVTQLARKGLERPAHLAGGFSADLCTDPNMQHQQPEHAGNL